MQDWPTLDGIWGGGGGCEQGRREWGDTGWPRSPPVFYKTLYIIGIYMYATKFILISLTFQIIIKYIVKIILSSLII
jgi:hypothetical protein